MLFHAAKFARRDYGFGVPEFGLEVAFIEAADLGQAEDVALAETFITWPQAQGWSDHRVVAEEVQPGMMARFARSYFDQLSAAMRVFEQAHPQGRIAVLFDDGSFTWGEIQWATDGKSTHRHISHFDTIQEARDLVADINANS